MEQRRKPMKKTIPMVFLCVAASFLPSKALGAQDLKIAYQFKAKAMKIISMSGAHVEYHSARYKLTKNVKGGLGRGDILVDYGDLAEYEIDHKKKVIGRTAHEDRLKAAELNAKLEEGSETFQKSEKQLGVKDAKLTVKKVGQEQVAGRDCEKWEASLGKIKAKISTDPSLALPAPLDALKRLRDSEGDDPLSELFDAVRGIKGVEMKSEIVMPIGPITIRLFREATEVAVGPLPASVFELPKDYSMEDAGKKALAELEEDLAKKSRKDQKNKK
jgi:hypothetical protein